MTQKQTRNMNTSDKIRASAYNAGILFYGTYFPSFHIPSFLFSASPDLKPATFSLQQVFISFVLFFPFLLLFSFLCSLYLPTILSPDLYLTFFTLFSFFFFFLSPFWFLFVFFLYQKVSISSVLSFPVIGATVNVDLDAVSDNEFDALDDPLENELFGRAVNVQWME